jgi:hypothetical protein
MTGLVPIVNGSRDQYVRYTLPQAAERLAAAHRDGARWDCRISSGGEGYRPLTPAESEKLVEAIRLLLG